MVKEFAECFFGVGPEVPERMVEVEEDALISFHERVRHFACEVGCKRTDLVFVEGELAVGENV